MKKSISLLMSLFLILSVLLIPSIAAYNNTDSLDSENSEYSVGIVEKDFETNIVEKKIYSKDSSGNERVETVDSWTDITSGTLSKPETFGMETLTSEQDTSGIFEKDNRNVVSNSRAFPFSAIVYIEAKFKNSNRTYRFSGFLIADNIVVTAAHCLYKEEIGGWPTSVTVKPGINSKFSMPFGLAKGRIAAVSTQWKESQDENYDWGAIKTYHSFVGNPGTLDIAISEDNSEFPARISGYPTEFPVGNVTYNQVFGDGIAYTNGEFNIAYQIDATSGQSGAPILDSHNIVRGIHSRGGAICNYGARITPNAFYYLNKFIEEND